MGWGIRWRIDQWHKIENPETESPKYGQLILTKLQSSFVDWFKVEKCWVWLAFFCWVEESKTLCCNVVPAVLGSLTSLFLFPSSLVLLYLCLALYHGFTVVLREEDQGEMSLCHLIWTRCPLVLFLQLAMNVLFFQNKKRRNVHMRLTYFYWAALSGSIEWLM